MEFTKILKLFLSSSPAPPLATVYSVSAGAISTSSVGLLVASLLSKPLLNILLIVMVS